MAERAWSVVLVLGLLVAASVQASPRIEPSASLSLDTAFDSNVFNGRGADVVTRVTPHGSLLVRTRRYRLLLSYDLGAWLYLHGTAENSLNHHGLVSFDERVTRRLSLHVADEIIYAKDPGFLTRAGVVAPQTAIFDNTVDAQLGYRLTRRMDVGLAYTYRLTRFGTPPAGSPPLYDGDEHDATASWAWQASRTDDLRVAHRFQYFTADNDGLAVSNSPTAAWHHQFLRSLDLRLEAGPIFYNALGTRPVPDTPGSGVTWRGAGVLRYGGKHWFASASALRDLVGGTGAGSVLWADYLYGEAGYRTRRRFEVHAGGGYFANGFAPDAHRLYDGVFVDMAATVTILPGLQVGGYYSFHWQRALEEGVAGAPLPSITRHIGGLRIVGTFGAEAYPPHGAAEEE